MISSSIKGIFVYLFTARMLEKTFYIQGKLKINDLKTHIYVFHWRNTFSLNHSRVRMVFSTSN